MYEKKSRLKQKKKSFYLIEPTSGVKRMRECLFRVGLKLMKQKEFKIINLETWG
jgi:hypothetical protein